MLSITQAHLNVIDPATMANMSVPLCAKAGFDTQVCQALKQKIASSPAGGLGKQAAGLCTHLGACSSAEANSCPISTKLLPEMVPVRAPLDLCTVEGVAGNEYGLTSKNPKED
jgi:hypothetical protein